MSLQFPKQLPAIRKPILYWQAKHGNYITAENNSIALLRHQLRGVKGVTFHAVR